jgi:hypothetical protein
MMLAATSVRGSVLDRLLDEKIAVTKYADVSPVYGISIAIFLNASDRSAGMSLSFAK